MFQNKRLLSLREWIEYTHRFSGVLLAHRSEEWIKTVDSQLVALIRAQEFHPDQLQRWTPFHFHWSTVDPASVKAAGKPVQKWEMYCCFAHRRSADCLSNFQDKDIDWLWSMAMEAASALAEGAGLSEVAYNVESHSNLCQFFGKSH